MKYITRIKAVMVREKIRSSYSRILEKKINCPENIAKIFRWLQNELQEHIIVIHLNSQMVIESYQVVSIGNSTGSMASPKDILRAALLTNIQSIILVHNHPGGVVEPSETDIDLTKTLKEAGKLLDINVIDHIIMGKGNCYSFKEHNLI